MEWPGGGFFFVGSGYSNGMDLVVNMLFPPKELLEKRGFVLDSFN